MLLPTWSLINEDTHPGGAGLPPPVPRPHRLQPPLLSYMTAFMTACMTAYLLSLLPLKQSVVLFTELPIQKKVIKT